ncbi:hypothetical protein DPMN_102893 [Dreissena polymorpha]|uniref:Uncharacterized protein n=1 Tax=Dreissena polymorpha TaxID=45954 RepID=A0A9D4H8V0_DREPO|nr:hypothetical protein DPMN_102893 [Dreissena polymorpha]
MPPRAKRRRVEVAQSLQAMGEDQEETTGRAEPDLPAPGIEHGNTSEPGTRAQGCEQGWLNMYAHVASQTRQKNWNGEFVDFISHLPKFRETSQQKVKIMKREIIVSHFGVIKNIERIGVWSDAFLINMAIFLARHGNKHLELIQYMHNVRTAASRFAGWADYDRQFRLKLSQNPTCRWDIIDRISDAIYAFHFGYGECRR